MYKQRSLRLALVIVAMLLLIGCSVQRAPSTAISAPTDVAPSAPEPSDQITPMPSATATGDEQPETIEPTSWTIGLIGEPTNVLPFSPDGRAAEPIVEVLFPAPVLSLNYTYTTTGILEQLPTEANGDVQIEPIAGFLDATGQFTVTETSQPTTTQQLSITFRWNPALRWADGTPVTAADSVFSYELYQQAQTSQEAQAVSQLIERYEQLDERTTRAVLKPGQIAPNYQLTAWPPLPRHALQGLPPEEALAQFQKQPLGYGPFSFAEQQPGERLVLRRNQYWPAADRLPELLTFRFFASANELREAIISGQVQVGAMERVPEDLYPYLDQDQQSGAAQVTYVAGPVYEHLDFNLATERLQDIRVRQALAYAINRAAMSDTLFGSKVEPLHSWILPEQRAFYAGDEQLTRYNYNVDKARALLDEAGYTDQNGDGVRETADGQPLTFELLTTDTPLRDAIARQLVNDFAAVGVELVLEVQPVDQFYSPTGPLYRRTFQLALFAWIAGADPGGLPLWSCNAVPTQENGYSGNNFTGWCYENAEWALRRANTTLDQRVRAQNYLKHQQLWSQELPVIPLLQRPLAVLAAPNMRGLAPDALAPITWNIDQWTN